MVTKGALVSINVISARDTIDIRHQVLWPSLKREECILPDDPDGLHLGAFVKGQLVSALSLFRTDTGMRLRKFATCVEWQGQGIGTALLQHAMATVQGKGASRLWCDARMAAAPFYARLGFKAEGEVFHKGGIAYVVMQCATAG